MAKKPTKVKRPRKATRGSGRVMKTISFSVKPETFDRLHAVMLDSEGSTSAWAEDVINRALDEYEQQFKVIPRPAEGAETPKIGPG